MRYAILDGDTVVNIVLWDGESPVEGSEHFTPVDEAVGPGWTRDGDEWIAPEPEPVIPEFHAEYMRQEAYRQESDPLFFKWQRGEATEQDWLDAIQSIRNRYPEKETP